MADDWDGIYVVRRVLETDPEFHCVYDYARQCGAVTTGLNYYGGAPALISRAAYRADRGEPYREWHATLAGVGNVLMGTFILRKTG
jgi:hypothetical protein